MRSIRNFVVGARHWQVFVVLIGLYAIGWFLIPDHAPTDVLKAVLTYWFPKVLLHGCFLLWPWLLGTSLADIIPATMSHPKVVLGAGLLFAFVYMPVSGLMPLSFSTLPLDVLSVSGIFYAFFFISRSLLTAENGSTPVLKAVVLPFLMLLFFPIGIWFIQPRINRVLVAHG